MATILQVDRLGEAREVVCTTMDEWWTINQYESNSIIVDKKPRF